ncbi:circadian clock protein KaiA [Coleofasciculus sp. FACHB-T130]|uniref:circadian clock protein KaiA n=1 Tax=Cyanophyceae TaxID=3028117 RepID=UPI001685BA99|nr:circadian clock protein KaiA [Coleofasciculus sp. FACHB-T130]MBD1878493.1 circadian clock protein KaiA [Coleofasciculus sp. FACHB-T130]
MHHPLSICTFVRSESLAQSLRDSLCSESPKEAIAVEHRYLLNQISSLPELFDWVEQYKQQIDCLVLQEDSSLRPLVNRLYEQGILLPVVILSGVADEASQGATTLEGQNPPRTAPNSTQALETYIYHPGEVYVAATEADKIARLIERAIAQFLTLAPTCLLPDRSITVDPITELHTQNFLMLQQRRLSEKLKERLGYLGVYYKRNPQSFFRYLSRTEKQELLQQLRAEYRKIVLSYFSTESTLNQIIDQFVTTAFFADLSVSQIVEIHMELMDDFSKKLKLEGRSEEVLLDYRLTLIDVIAHLCEMYRRSIPRES